MPFFKKPFTVSLAIVLDAAVASRNRAAKFTLFSVPAQMQPFQPMEVVRLWIVHLCNRSAAHFAVHALM